MNKRSHERKKHLARKLMTAAAWAIHRPIFNSFAWTERRDAIADRVKRQQGAAHERALKGAKLRLSA